MAFAACLLAFVLLAAGMPLKAEAATDYSQSYSIRLAHNEEEAIVKGRPFTVGLVIEQDGGEDHFTMYALYDRIRFDASMLSLDQVSARTNVDYYIADQTGSYRGSTDVVVNAWGRSIDGNSWENPADLLVLTFTPRGSGTTTIQLVDGQVSTRNGMNSFAVDTYDLDLQILKEDAVESGGTGSSESGGAGTAGTGSSGTGSGAAESGTGNTGIGGTGTGDTGTGGGAAGTGTDNTGTGSTRSGDTGGTGSSETGSGAAGSGTDNTGTGSTGPEVTGTGGQAGSDPSPSSPSPSDSAADQDQWQLSQWVWTDDYRIAKAILVHPADPNRKASLYGTIEEKVIREADTSREGLIRYTASVSFKGESYTDVKEKIVEKVQDQKEKTSLSKAVLKLSKSSYTYTGKAIVPTIKSLKLSGKTLHLGIDYKISCKNNLVPGRASLVIRGIGDYSGKLEKTYRILPKGTAIRSIKPEKGSMTIKWKKQAAQTTGYQIRYAGNKAFTKNKKTLTIGKNTTLSKTVKKLKKGKIYYVQIRTYQTVGGSKIYSAWSARKKVTIH